MLLIGVFLFQIDEEKLGELIKSKRIFHRHLESKKDAKRVH